MVHNAFIIRKVSVDSDDIASMLWCIYFRVVYLNDAINKKKKVNLIIAPGHVLQ